MSMRGKAAGKTSSKERQRLRIRRQRLRTNLLWGGLALVSFVLIAIVVVNSAVNPQVGEPVPVLRSDHIPVGEDPGRYNSDPPTSGAHYASELDPGFYDPAASAGLAPHSDAYLIHNLEHGYVIFWYNCGSLDPTRCGNLQSEIRAVMDGAKIRKLIAVYRPSLDVPVVMTSWGRQLRMTTFDPSLAARFIRNNLNKAPEPNAS